MWWLPLVPIGFVTDKGSRSRWLLMPGVVILTALTSSLGKLMIRRPRPGAAYRVVPWGRLSAAGFPSTHSACAFAIASWSRDSRHGRWLHAVAFLVGYSRMRCRAHHSTDVVAGAILGYRIAWQIDKSWSGFRSGPATSHPGDHDRRFSGGRSGRGGNGCGSGRGNDQRPQVDEVQTRVRLRLTRVTSSNRTRPLRKWRPAGQPAVR